ncbi:MAG: hypothetical protein JWQ24_1915 [Tardiphaga sp.]|nr:hypothetical protein [Tardiphaga sp.]
MRGALSSPPPRSIVIPAHAGVQQSQAFRLVADTCVYRVTRSSRVTTAFLFLYALSA